MPATCRSCHRDGIACTLAGTGRADMLSSHSLCMCPHTADGRRPWVVDGNTELWSVTKALAAQTRAYVAHFCVRWAFRQLPRAFKTACQVCLVARPTLADLNPAISSLLFRSLKRTYNAKIPWFLWSLQHLWWGLWDHHHLYRSSCGPSQRGARSRSGSSSSFGCPAVLDIESLGPIRF